MAGRTSVVSSTPGFVEGSFGAKDVRLATMGHELPGLFERGDFAASQRAAGANMSLDIAQGRAMLLPGGTHQGLYLARRTSGTAYNTGTDGGYTWAAADPTNPRIDLFCLEVRDTAEDASGATGWGFRVVDGTPHASASHQLETAYWPAVPTGCLPISAIRVPATATTLTTANITNLNPILAGRPYSPIDTAETTTSASYTRLATPDFVAVYVPHAHARVRLLPTAHWKISSASGTQAAAIFVDGVQLKVLNISNGAPSSVMEGTVASLSTFYSRLAPRHFLGSTPAAGATSDVSDAVLSVEHNAGTQTTDLLHLTAGWHVIELRFKTSANTLTVRNRRLWAEVIA